MERKKSLLLKQFLIKKVLEGGSSMLGKSIFEDWI